MGEYKIFKVQTEEQLNHIVDKYNQKQLVEKIEFVNSIKLEHFLMRVGINPEEYRKENNYIDEKNNIFISTSSKGFSIISTYGLVGIHDMHENKFYNSLICQIIVLRCIIKEIKNNVKNKSTFNIDSIEYEKLSYYTNIMLSNRVFLCELLCKYYLSIFEDDEIKHTHDIKELYNKTIEKMFKNNHNNTVFHKIMYVEVKSMCNHIAIIENQSDKSNSKKFKISNVKYNDNANDPTLYNFYKEGVLEVMFEKCEKLSTWQYAPRNPIYLETGELERLIKNNRARKSEIEIKYRYLIDIKEN